MITPIHWIPFADEESKLSYLKNLKLYPKTAKISTPLCYCGHFSEEKSVLCEVRGYVDPWTLVIQIENRLHCIHPECLSEMKTGRSDWLKDALATAAPILAPLPIPESDFSFLPHDFVVFDIETTGLSRESEIIELAAIRLVDGKKTATFEQFIRPDGDLPEEIIALTGITPLDLWNAPSIAEVLPQFLDFIGESVLVGQNIDNFDLPICNHWTTVCKLPPIQNPTIDTLPLSRKKLKLPSHALPALAAALQIEVETSHRALADVETTLQCFIRLSQLPDLPSQPSQKLSSFSRAPKSSEIVSKRKEFDENHPLYGKICVITGDLSTLRRPAAMQRLADVGAINADRVTKKTDFLILGQQKEPAHLSEKQRKAEQYGIPCLTEEIFLALLQGDTKLSDEG